MSTHLRVFHVSCPSCGTEFPIDPAKVAPEGVAAICSTCMRVFPVHRPEELEAPFESGVVGILDVEVAEADEAEAEIFESEEAGSGVDVEAAGTEPEASVEESDAEDFAVSDSASWGEIAIEETPIDGEAGSDSEAESADLDVTAPREALDATFEEVDGADAESTFEVADFEVGTPDGELRPSIEVDDSAFTIDVEEFEVSAEEFDAPVDEADSSPSVRDAAPEAGGGPAEDAIDDAVVADIEIEEEAAGADVEATPTPADTADLPGRVAASTPPLAASPPAAFEDLSSFTNEVLAEAAREDSAPPVDRVRAAPEKVERFGRRDPHERARHLARVLVSDIIAYYPVRYQESLARRTLAEDFADEIRKSYREYVDQVGAEMAESTPYFTDALNHVLGRGEKFF